jgi:hypothetical protein
MKRHPPIRRLAQPDDPEPQVSWWFLRGVARIGLPVLLLFVVVTVALKLLLWLAEV